jgi:hypothetical protein
MTSAEVSPWLISVCMFSPKFLALVPASNFFISGYVAKLL